MTQAHIFYSGMVQGVGFRFTVQRYAADSGLCGWVKNLKDGRVEVLLEGKKEDIKSLLENIQQQMDGYIRDQEITYAPAAGQFQGFEINF